MALGDEEVVRSLEDATWARLEVACRVHGEALHDLDCDCTAENLAAVEVAEQIVAVVSTRPAR